MSTDFIALFDCPRGPQARVLLFDALRAEPPEVAAVVERWRDRWRVKTWETTDDPPEIIGPGGFVLRFEARTLELYHMTPFGLFTGDPPARAVLRGVCRLVAAVVGSTRAIYTHELMPYEGEDLAESEARLRELVGPSAEGFDALEAAEHFGPRAWYVEAFGETA